MTIYLTFLTIIFGIVGLVIWMYKLISIIKFEDISGNWLTGIWLSGLLAFLIAFIRLLSDISDIFAGISEAERPDINAIAGGFGKAISSSLSGLIILTILLLLWGLLKGLIR